MAKPRFKMQDDKSVLLVVDMIEEPKPSLWKRLQCWLKKRALRKLGLDKATARKTAEVIEHHAYKEGGA